MPTPASSPLPSVPTLLTATPPLLCTPPTCGNRPRRRNSSAHRGLQCLVSLLAPMMPFATPMMGSASTTTDEPTAFLPSSPLNSMTSQSAVSGSDGRRDMPMNRPSELIVDRWYSEVADTKTADEFDNQFSTLPGTNNNSDDVNTEYEKRPNSIDTREQLFSDILRGTSRSLRAHEASFNDKLSAASRRSPFVTPQIATKSTEGTVSTTSTLPFADRVFVYRCHRELRDCGGTSLPGCDTLFITIRDAALQDIDFVSGSPARLRRSISELQRRLVEAVDHRHYTEARFWLATTAVLRHLLREHGWQVHPLPQYVLQRCSEITCRAQFTVANTEFIILRSALAQLPKLTRYMGDYVEDMAASFVASSRTPPTAVYLVVLLTMYHMMETRKKSGGDAGNKSGCSRSAESNSPALQLPPHFAELARRCLLDCSMSPVVAWHLSVDTTPPSGAPLNHTSVNTASHGDGVYVTLIYAVGLRHPRIARFHWFPHAPTK